MGIMFKRLPDEDGYEVFQYNIILMWLFYILFVIPMLIISRLRNFRLYFRYIFPVIILVVVVIFIDSLKVIPKFMKTTYGKAEYIKTGSMFSVSNPLTYKFKIEN